jgi:hypothetical protein
VCACIVHMEKLEILYFEGRDQGKSSLFRFPSIIFKVLCLFSDIVYLPHGFALGWPFCKSVLSCLLKVQIFKESQSTI